MLHVCAELWNVFAQSQYMLKVCSPDILAIILDDRDFIYIICLSSWSPPSMLDQNSSTVYHYNTWL